MDHGPHGPHGQEGSLIFAEETFRIRAAVFEVKRVMGAGFLEAVYQECLCLEFEARDIRYAASRPLRLSYKGRPLRQTYVPDFICFDAILVEIKATRELATEHKAQVLNYLSASGLKVGLLVNFGVVPATIVRLVS
jgi:GxxExxY protein